MVLELHDRALRGQVGDSVFEVRVEAVFQMLVELRVVVFLVAVWAVSLVRVSRPFAEVQDSGDVFDIHVVRLLAVFQSQQEYHLVFEVGIAVLLLEHLPVLGEVIHEDCDLILPLEVSDVLEVRWEIDAVVVELIIDFAQRADAVVVLLLLRLVVFHAPLEALLVVVADVHEPAFGVVEARRCGDV